MPWIRRRALLIAVGFPVQYRALRCAHEAGLEVFVLGGAEAGALRYSRFCRGFAQFDGLGSDPPALNLDEMRNLIESRVSAWGTDLILPADIGAVALLGRLKGALSVRVFPVPEPEDFERLDDKWSFHHLCRQLGIAVPKSWLFPSKEALFAAARNGELPEESVVKPTRLFGEIGVRRFRAQSAMQDLAAIDYCPLMVQEFIDGVDVNCSIFACDGKSRARLSYADLPNEKRFDSDPRTLNEAERIVAYLKLNGIFNFDTRRTYAGAHYFLECNPRPFMTMHMSAQAGVNCFAAGIEGMDGAAGPAVEMAECTVRKWRGLLRAAVIPWRLTRTDFKVVKDALADPLPLAHEVFLALSRKLSSNAAHSRRSRISLAVADGVLSSMNGALRWLRGGAPIAKIKM